MDPIILSSLISTGKNLLDYVFSPKQADSSEVNFERLIKNNIQTQSVNNHIRASSIKSIDDLQAAKNQLKSELLEKTGCDSTTELICEKGHFSLKKSNGKEVSLMHSSELKQIAEKLHQLHLLSESLSAFPGSNVTSLEQAMPSTTLIKTTWKL